MRAVWYGVFALLVLPVAVLIGAEGIKKLKKPPRDEWEAAPPKPPKPPKVPKTVALSRELGVPLEVAEALKAAGDAAKDLAKLDRNGDGLLDEDELSQKKWGALALRYDSDGDGRLTVTELANYVEASEREKKEKKAKKAADAGQPVEPPAGSAASPRPVVYRAGRLPPGLPGWFEKLDTDKDGQVGLYEWRGGERDAEEFLTMDLNQDGFVTAEEMLRAQRSRR